jgi:hypothetical protein
VVYNLSVGWVEYYHGINFHNKKSPKKYNFKNFNKGFLKDLETAAKARKKELGHDKIKPGSMPSSQKIKIDKKKTRFIFKFILKSHLLLVHILQYLKESVDIQ